MVIDATGMEYQRINAVLRGAGEPCEIKGLCGQRFIGAGMSEKQIALYGVPGNALGAYLNGACVTVYGNAQDAVGDTMNAGRITVHGNIGDAAGYAMRGGEIYVRGSAGYRAGIHMKAYREKVPKLVIGGVAGSFLGEYQAGGVIVVLGLEPSGKRIVSNFPCTGMHGGKLFLRSMCEDIRFPVHVKTRYAQVNDLEELRAILLDYCNEFGYDIDKVLDHPFTVAEPDTNNPYRQMYVAN